MNRILGFSILLFISMNACVTPYLGESVIAPLVDEEKPYAIQGSWNHTQFQVAVGAHGIVGGQMNFPRNNSLVDSNYFVVSSLTGARLFGGLQTGVNTRNHSAYFLGGLGAGVTNYLEYNSNVARVVAPDSLVVSYKSAFQSVFVEGGFKLNKGYIGIGNFFSIDAPTFYLLHFGAKLVYLNNPTIFNDEINNSRITGSPIFGFDKSIPSKISPTYQIGVSWIFAGKTINLLSDLTYHLGNSMFQPFVYRLGLGIRF